MPICKHCHHTISKFDKDICPYCGVKKPIDDRYETKDVTSFMGATGQSTTLYKSKLRVLAAFLCLIFGFLGIHSFYLGYKKRGFAELLISMFLDAGAGLIIFFFGEPRHSALAFLLPLAPLWLFYAIVSIKYFTKDSLTDSNGVFLR